MLLVGNEGTKAMSENTNDPAAALAKLRDELKEKHSKRCYDECTRDVVFLFQRKRFNLIGLPAGFDCTEGYIDYDKSRDEYADDLDDHGIPSDVAAKLQGDGIPLREFAELGLEFGEWGQSCVTEEWITEGVWLDRAEATQFGERKAYNYPDGWRVYGVPSYGDLSGVLKLESPLITAIDAVLANVAAKDAEIAELRKECKEMRALAQLGTHRVIACGVAAAHPDASLMDRGAYADHAVEEALDFAGYLVSLKRELRKVVGEQRTSVHESTESKPTT